ncbi:MAG: hypothetical protein AAF191_16435, partial [Verrucomicrobiota bacterium]
MTPSHEKGASGMPASTSSPYATAEVLVKDLATLLQRGDLKGFLDLTGTEAADKAVRERLSEMLVDQGYRLSREEPIRMKGLQDGGKEVQLVFEPASGGGSPETLTLTIASDETKSWGVEMVSVPGVGGEAKEGMAAAVPNAQGKKKGPKSALDTAAAFLSSVVGKEFGSARKAADSAKLSDEKLAALFIVVEEGGFEAHPERPLISTVAGKNKSWIIARLKSAAQVSEFGIEMQRPGEDSPWKVVGLNFDKLIQKAALQAGAGDVYYAPLKKNLQGGDQIVLYFEFDDTVMNARAEKQ